MRKLLPILGILMIIIIIVLFFTMNPKEVLNISGTITYSDKNNFTIVNDKGDIYKITNSNEEYVMGSSIELTCEDNKNVIDIKNCEIKNYIPNIPLEDDNNDKEIEEEESKELFQEYYEDAEKIVNNMTLDEKISQLLIVGHIKKNDIDIQKENQFGGIIFFESDFKNKTKEQVQNMINELQTVSKIPLLTAIDEEGGKVSRISSNKNLVTTPFKSSQDLYKEGGFDKIKEDVINKSSILSELGLNLNLAPVVDVSTNKNDYIYARTLGKGTDLTSIYAVSVIEASKDTFVSYTLKHFPGYGNNLDTHIGSSVDKKSYDEILINDIPPFKMGIEAGAEAVMVSHNIVSAIDSVPSSLSVNINNILRNDLGFTGVVITDDISMGAVKDYEDVYIKAILAGNDLIITSDYKDAIKNIKKGLTNNEITENDINEKVIRIISWKYYKNLL